MERTRIVAVALCVTLALAGVTGCAKPSAPRGGELEGVTWVLRGYALEGSVRQVPASAVVELGFKQGEVSGRAVNSYSGPYTASPGGSIQIGPLASTLMAGPPELMAVEQAYFDALEAAAFYYSDGEQLVLYDKDGKESLRFARSKTSLTGRIWKADGINNGKGGVESIATGTEVTVEFLTDGTMRGNGGVNTYSASYETTGTHGMAIGTPIATKAAGPPDAMRQEAAYFASLARVTTYALTTNRLELRASDGALQASFTVAAK